MEAGTTNSEAGWAECESVIRQFEYAWRDGQRPNVGSFVTPDSPHATRLLVELVHIDLEFRLRSDEDARAEDYLARFPEISDKELTLDLLAAEFALRNRHRPPAWPEEYWLRFPELISELHARLPAKSNTSGYDATRPAERPGAPLGGPPVIAGYEILGELGRGGMGVVYQARDLLLHRTVAVKTLATIPRADSCARFAREAEVIARLDHAHIVPIYDVGEWRTADGPAVPYFVMKWYVGGSLDAAPSGPGTDTAAHARLVEVIAKAVHHAHQRGVLHRDLKPSNILLDDTGRPHVADFGLAGWVDPVEAATLTGVIAGTPAYMAPEQAKSPRQVSTAADVYGLGAILYHQLTGQAPFSADTPLATLELVAAAAPPRPSEVNPAVPRDLDTICLKCLEKDPARRYASAAEVADDLERWRTGMPIAARPTRAWEYAWRRLRRHPIACALGLVTLATLVGAVMVLADSNARIRAKEREATEAYLRECALRYRLEETLTREQRELYLERVAFAGRLYASNQLPQAWAALDTCPNHLRGWEWRYLDSLRRADGVVLTGHQAWVARTAFLPDGRVVSGDNAGSVRVWDVAGRTEQRRWRVEQAPVTELFSHPTRNLVATADGNAVAVWDVDTGTPVFKLAGAHWAAFSPDGSRIALGIGRSVSFLTVPNWEPDGELCGHRARVIAGAFTPDGKRLVTSSVDHTIRTWDLESEKQLASRAVPAPVMGLVFADSGRLLVESHQEAVLLTDPTTGALRDRLDIPTIGRVAVATGPDPHAVALSGPNGEITVWDVARRRFSLTLRGHTALASGLALSPNGKRLASCGGDQTVRVWDLARPLDVRTLACVGNGIGGLSLSPDGQCVAVGPRTRESLIEGKSLVLDIASGRQLCQVPGGTNVAFHPASGLIAAGLPEGGVMFWDPVADTEVWRCPLTELRDPKLAVGPWGRRFAFTRDGSRLASWEVRGAVHLWDPAARTIHCRLDTGNKFVYALEFSPDGSRIAVATADAVQVWDVTTQKRVAWGKNSQATYALAFSPDGRWLATVDQDREVRLRDAATGQAVRTFVGNPMRVNGLAFSPDGTRLATAGSDRTVRLWDVESGRELLSLPGVSEVVTGVAWDKSGNCIYAVDDGVRVWTAPPNG